MAAVEYLGFSGRWQDARGGVKNRIAERSEFLRCKKQRACTKNLMQALDLFGARTGIEPRRPFERGILSLMSDIAIQHCLMKLCFLSDFSIPPKAAGSFKSDSLVLGDVLFSNL